MTRPARPEDVDELCRALPEVEFGISWGDRPTYKVRGKGFLLFRAPHHSAVDPTTGEPFDDLLVVTVPDAAEKQALVDDPRTPFFSIDHFRNTNAVLVRRSRLAEISRDELAEVIAEAWATRAPRSLVERHFAETPAHPPSGGPSGGPPSGPFSGHLRGQGR